MLSKKPLPGEGGGGSGGADDNIAENNLTLKTLSYYPLVMGSLTISPFPS